MVAAMSRASFTRKLCFTQGRVMPTVVHLLEGVLSNGVRRHLTADDHQRDRIHVSGGDAGHGIGQARGRR